MSAVCARGAAVFLAVCPLVICAQSGVKPGAAMVVEMENIVEAQARGVAWKPAILGLPLSFRDRLRTGEYSRAAVRFTDLSVLRVDELTTIEISQPVKADGTKKLDVKRGGTYYFSRDKAQEIEIRTPAANGALRGTEFELRVAADGKTRLTMFDGEVELSNAQGRLVLKSGEQAEVEVGKRPRRTPMIEAVNIIQWCLYYPAVLDPAELRMGPGEQRALGASLAAYRAGDLLGALEMQPTAPGLRSTEERLFRASLIMAVGQVDKARAALAGVPAGDSRRQAIEQMIAAVKLQPWVRATEPRTSSEWLAKSYYLQSRSDLAAALRSARKATELSPEFGYAWARVAELEFSFGQTSKAMKVLEHALELSPRNAQAHSLQGFLLSAENRTGAARRSFDSAIELDGALGNAWLGRGLTLIRQNRAEEGRRDLQIADVMEPNRSILRSYLGKAFSQVGINEKANLEFERAKQIDQRDPTPWLYSAIQRRQENRYNEAIDDLEKSIDLNKNRRVYRSEFLLDQDRAVRGTNLAAIYEKNGMTEQSVREAIRAVNKDYGSAAAHLFLSNSYSALSDPTQIRLRYESSALNELLLSNLLSPVGGGSLSQFVSQQEYSKLFEKDGLGISSFTEYLGTGDFLQTASQYGTFGNVSYALDAEYQDRRGTRQNNDLSSFQGYVTFKLQVTPQDSVFLQAHYLDYRSGDVTQYYNPRDAETVAVAAPNGAPGFVRVPNRPVLTTRVHDTGEPILLLAGYHHEWSPNQHTLLLLGRLESNQTVTAEDTDQFIVRRNVLGIAPPDARPTVIYEGDTVRVFPNLPALRALAGRGGVEDIGINSFDYQYESHFRAYNVELQHIATFAGQTALLGGRYQRGEFDTHVRLTDYANGTQPFDSELFPTPPARQDPTVDFERINAYVYDTWRISAWLSLTGGVSYDRIEYPDNFRTTPVNDRQDSVEQFSPKAGVLIEPWRGATIRAAYTEALGGSTFDESVRLEPTQVAGFLQSYRTLISESLIGSVAGSKYQLTGVSVEQKLPTRTYLGIEYQNLQQRLDRTIGVFDQPTLPFESLGYIPSSLTEEDRYREGVIIATVNQLVGRNWAFGSRYRFTESKLKQELPEVLAGIDRVQDGDLLGNLLKSASTRTEATLHELNLYALYNHSCGFFARAEANWYQQQSDSFITTGELSAPNAAGIARPRLKTRNLGVASEDFWQFNFLAGYRFYRNQCELSAGVLNITGEDYFLNPLNPYTELPREPTAIVRCKLTF